MEPPRDGLEGRVIRAAEAALTDHQYVSAIDVLTGIGFIAPSHIKEWRDGRVDFLERTIQANLNKVSRALATFRGWAHDKQLKPSETHYVRRTRSGTVDLQFSKSGDPNIERMYRMRFVSSALSERKSRQIAEKLNCAPQPVVFEVIKDTACSECGAAIEKNRLLLMEDGQPLCLPCARLDSLEYLPAGDTALTRRAAKHSELTAIVVRFSHSRGRYERQGILVEVTALQKAEQECSGDAEQRAAARAMEAKRRKDQDRELVVEMTARIRTLFPGCPAKAAHGIAAHTALRGSGRVGRTAAGRDLEVQALVAAVTAAVRHNRTEYDILLARGLDRASAREQVADDVHAILEAWS